MRKLPCSWPGSMIEAETDLEQSGFWNPMESETAWYMWVNLKTQTLPQSVVPKLALLEHTLRCHLYF